ncbi:cyclin-dependent kinase inhibitor 3 isoform X3 [Synchiropus splendidus]|uniref:cyclin-dependent kinase inhibitor 3 isoform X3 n=1 Tax=Synchiropus splendidus TaxID=270530 RepID=UPI00237DF0F6|nr:cyclin-dependent kinase inhibitor 3 isoform X3 [Synchiropus splendidus]
MHCSCGRHHSALVRSAPALLSLSGGHMGPFAFTSADMRKNEFDSSSDEDEPEDAQASPLNISWLQVQGHPQEPPERRRGAAEPGGAGRLRLLHQRGAEQVPRALAAGHLRAPGLRRAPLPLPGRRRPRAAAVQPDPGGAAGLPAEEQEDRAPLLRRPGTLGTGGCLSADPALSRDDGAQSHRVPQGAPRKRSHPDGEAIQLPARVS